MNDFNISSDRHIRIKIGEVTFNKLLVSLQDIIFTTYPADMLNTLSTDSKIQLQIKN